MVLGVDIVSDLAKDERIIDEQFHEDESCVEDTATPAAVNKCTCHCNRGSCWYQQEEW